MEEIFVISVMMKVSETSTYYDRVCYYGLASGEGEKISTSATRLDVPKSKRMAVIDRILNDYDYKNMQHDADGGVQITIRPI